MPSYTNLVRAHTNSVTLPDGQAISTTDVQDYTLAFYAPLLSEAEPLFQGVMTAIDAPFTRELTGDADETRHLEVVLRAIRPWVICAISSSRLDVQIELWCHRHWQRVIVAGRTLQNFDLVAPVMVGENLDLHGVVRFVPGAEVDGQGATIMLHGFTYGR